MARLTAEHSAATALAASMTRQTSSPALMPRTVQKGSAFFRLIRTSSISCNMGKSLASRVNENDRSDYPAGRFWLEKGRFPARRVGLTHGGKAEALSTHGGFGHQAALDVLEHGDAVLEAGVLRRAGLEGDGAHSRVQGVFPRDEFVQSGLVLEGDDFGVGLATDLRANGHLREVGVADHLPLFEDFALAVGASGDQAALADGRIDRIAVGIVDEAAKGWILRPHRIERALHVGIQRVSLRLGRGGGLATRQAESEDGQ